MAGQGDADKWTHTTSEIYRRLAQVAVPSRQQQIAALLTLMPFDADKRFRVVELASGEGRLSQAILTAFPKATLLALDGEKTMRRETMHRLKPFGDRGSVEAFDILRPDWYAHLDNADVVVSSLCIHHLDGKGKQHLFKTVQQRLSARGALLIADLVQPVNAQIAAFFASSWDESAETQSMQHTGGRDLFHLFENEHWNYYRYPDPFDKPSPLFDQLHWLKAAGFALADCFWMQAGHAIYGGYQAEVGNGNVTYEDALTITRTVLEDH